MLLKVWHDGVNSLFDDIRQFDWNRVRFGVLNEPGKAAVLLVCRNLAGGPIAVEGSPDWEAHREHVDDQDAVFSVSTESVGSYGYSCSLLLGSGRVLTVLIGPTATGYLMTDSGKTVEILSNKAQ